MRPASLTLAGITWWTMRNVPNFGWRVIHLPLSTFRPQSQPLALVRIAPFTTRADVYYVWHSYGTTGPLLDPPRIFPVPFYP